MALPALDRDLHRCDTNPPPAGSDDAYSAPTKVGPMPKAVIEAMMAECGAPESGVQDAVKREPPKAKARAAEPIFVPILHDEFDDNSGFEPTTLAPKKEAPEQPSIPPVSMTSSGVVPAMKRAPAFPEWVAGTPPYRFVMPAPERLSDRALAGRIAIGVAAFIAVTVPFLVWLFGV